MPPLPSPALPDSCWEVDHRACPDWDSYDPEDQALADAYAGQTLRMLTAYRVGGCPITVRPCLARCAPSSYLVAPTPSGSGALGVAGPGLNPFINANGAWVNGCGCSTGDCSCVQLCEVLLPPPVGWVVEVRLDGAVVDEDSYRIDNERRLVRTDGGCWPSCQDMTAPADGEGAFSVTYLNAYLVDAIGSYVAGILACEFIKAITGGECQLPAGVTSVVRQGVTLEIAAGAFPDGLTGIREVDAYIQRWNPNQLKMQPKVWSPDYRPTRRTTWPHV